MTMYAAKKSYEKNVKKRSQLFVDALVVFLGVLTGVNENFWRMSLDTFFEASKKTKKAYLVQAFSIIFARIFRWPGDTALK